MTPPRNGPNEVRILELELSKKAQVHQVEATPIHPAKQKRHHNRTVGLTKPVVKLFTKRILRRIKLPKY